MKTLILLEFNQILDSISHTLISHTIGHLFIADIKFHNKCSPKKCFLTRSARLFLKKTKPYVPTKGLPFN